MPVPHNNLQEKIVSTLVYFDIFNFPLTKEEIVFFLHTSQRSDKKDIEKYLSKISHKTVQNRTFYFLPKRGEIVHKRITKEPVSVGKLMNAEKTIQLLRFIPTVAFIGISGSLAMKNGDKKSDIDLFVVSLPHTVWITRFLLWVMLTLMGKRRKRNTEGIDEICVNMIIDRNGLLFSVEKQDIYTAHEIVQVLPVVDKFKTYHLFLQKNAWILVCLANSFTIKQYKDTFPLFLGVCCYLLQPLEVLLKNLQLWYMKKHRTIEQTTATFIAFHPFNYRDTIVKEFEKRKKRYAL